MSYEANPPWVDKIVAKNWTSLESMVGPERMPAQTEGSSPRRRLVQDYGCGHYGCVAPTGTAEIVFKVTSDPLEAHFVASALLIASKDKSFGWPIGIVRYENIVQLEGSYHSRPVFGLWREEAYDVGALVHAHRRGGPGPEWFRKLDTYDQMAFERFGMRLGRFKDWAARFKMSTDRSANRTKLLDGVRQYERWARDAIELEEAENGFERVVKASWSAPQKLAACLRACEINAELMANEPVGTEIGEALDFYMEHGLLLADVHLNNIGRLLREDYSSGVWGITDPGHAVPLDDRFAAVVVPSLVAA